MTPDKEDSKGNGTKINPSCSSGSISSGFLIEYFHGPFKFIQSFLSSCGLGYSCHTFLGSKLIPQLVFILSPNGSQFHLSSGDGSSDSDESLFSLVKYKIAKLMKRITEQIVKIIKIILILFHFEFSFSACRVVLKGSIFSLCSSI